MLKVMATGEGLETGGEGWGALITWVELWEGSVRAAWKTPPTHTVPEEAETDWD